MTPEKILKYCEENFDGISIVQSWGETGVFYNPDGTLKRGIYILTLKEKNGENDKASMLSRKDVFRLNIGITKKTYATLFVTLPKRPSAGGIVETGTDFTETDILMPHPVYAWMAWVCVLNPSEKTFETIKPLIAESYEYAKQKFAKKK